MHSAPRQCWVSRLVTHCAKDQQIATLSICTRVSWGQSHKCANILYSDDEWSAAEKVIQKYIKCLQRHGLRVGGSSFHTFCKRFLFIWIPTKLVAMMLWRVDDGPPTCSLSQSMFCASTNLKKVMEHTHPYLIIVRYSMVIVWYCVVLPLLRYAHRPHHSLTLSSTTQIFLDPTHLEKELRNFPLPCPTKILK